MRRLNNRGVVYEEQGGRVVNRYHWQLFFPILLAVILFTLVSGVGVKPEILRIRLLLYGVAALSYLFAMQRQNRTRTFLYQLMKESIHVRQLDKANRIDIEYWINYSKILWAGAYTNQTALRRVREWYAVHGAAGFGREAAAQARGSHGWQGIGIIYEEDGNVIAKHLEVSSQFFQYLDRQINLARHIIRKDV
jgi:hypothetical protein